MAQALMRYHTVHYRRLAAKDGDPTLADLCREALSATDGSGAALWNRPLNRIMHVNDADGDRQVIMNKVADQETAVFGEICLAHSNDLQALLRLTTQTVRLSELTTATVFDLAETAAPTGAQFIRGTGYWLAVGNHLFAINLGALSIRSTLDYLAWLMEGVSARHGIVRSPSDFLVEIDVSEVGDAGIGEVRNLRVKGNSALGVRVPVTQDEQRKPKRFSRTVRRDHQVSDQAVPLMNVILGPSRAQSLLDSLGPGEYVTAEGEVKVSGSRTDASREQIRRIAHEIADETDAEVTVEGKFGKIKNGDVILRTKMPFAPSNEGGTLLDFDNVADQLQTVYGRFVQDGKIRP